MLFQSTRPVWGATQHRRPAMTYRGVSIHAPRVGRDARTAPTWSKGSSFNPRAPCGARLSHGCRKVCRILVSIHAPRVGRDPAFSAGLYGRICFNPRAPCGARPRMPQARSPRQSFNPRAPCGARRSRVGASRSGSCFNPRAPCGARRQLESRLPPFATYLWAFPSTNTIFSAPETHAPPAA